MSDYLPHAAWVRAAPDSAAHSHKVFLFLHGILGSGGNLRALAQAFVRSAPGHEALLVDLRQHGRSRGAPPPHDVDACADDLLRLEASLPKPVVGVVGHSFGGKVALAFHQRRPALERVATLDSLPGVSEERAGSEQTISVLEMLERLPRHYQRREQFVESVHAEGHSRAIADWLAMNLERSAHGFTFATELDTIRALLDSYFALDLWPVIEHSAARIDLVIGGRSRVWSERDRERALALQAQRPERVHVHLLPDAAHWVHVDSPQALRDALFPAQRAMP